MPEPQNFSTKMNLRYGREVAPSNRLDALGYLEFHLDSIEQLSRLPITPEVSALLQGEVECAKARLTEIQNQ